MDNIKKYQRKLAEHPIYKELESPKNLKTFMHYHVYAVFDFMSLLKSIQNKIAPANNIWTPSNYPNKVVRFINEIVIAEESDTLPNGECLSHFEMYLLAMREHKLDTSLIEQFVNGYKEKGTFNFGALPSPVKSFVVNNINTALNGDLEEVLGSFLYGREKLIPEIFQPIINSIKNEYGPESTSHYYFQRHIDIDGDDHGPMAKYCLETICDTPQKQEKALKSAEKALKLRLELWDGIYSEIKNNAEISGHL